MTDLETQILGLIQGNRHLSEDLKKNYILALFLMDTGKHEEYLKLMQNFTRRCQEVEKGIFILKADEAADLRQDFDAIKKDILKKIQSDKPKNQ